MLLEKIKTDMNNARKQKDSDTAVFLATLLSEAAMVGKNNGNRESTDEEVIQIIKKFVKNTNELIDAFEKRQRDTTKSKKELEILNQYLPKQLSEAELIEKIQNIVNSLPNKSIGAVMKELKTQYDGLYDGKLASTLIKNILG